MADALEMVETTLDARGQQVEVHMSSPCLMVHADPGAARQALANLLGNASKYGGATSAIQMRAEQTAEQVRLVVVDDGPGIAADQQASLFERYYRVHPRHPEPGVGLGLAIVKGIAEAHGGCVGVESAAGTGTAIWFTLPLAKELV
jgi:two-component system OmpR family sensor kinase